MAQSVAARNVKLHDLKAKFGLQRVEAEPFFGNGWMTYLS
jgi:hypothetical protein